MLAANTEDSHTMPSIENKSNATATCDNRIGAMLAEDAGKNPNLLVVQDNVLGKSIQLRERKEEKL